MRAIERHIRYPGRGEWIEIVDLADIHGGTKRCQEKKLDAAIQYIATHDNTWFGLGGDPLECIVRRDTRYNESEIAPWLYGVQDIAAAQVDWLCEKVRPIAHKCLWVNCGNHEGQLLIHNEVNAYAHIVKFIKQVGGIQEQIGLGYRGFLLLRTKRSTRACTTLTVFAEHGWGGGRLRGANVLNGDRIFGSFECDVFLSGHRHMAHVNPHTVAIPRRNRVMTVTKIAGYTGTFRDSTLPHDEMDPGGYEDMKGYNPADVAGVKIRFQPDSFELRGEVWPY